MVVVVQDAIRDKCADEDLKQRRVRKGSLSEIFFYVFDDGRNQNFSVVEMSQFMTKPSPV